MFLILFISTAYIFSFSQFGVSAYESFMYGDQYFQEGTKIASVSVEGKTKNGAMQLLDESLTQWLDETTITLKYKEKEYSIDLLDTFHVDVETSVSKAKQGVSNPAFVQLNSLDDVLMNMSKKLLDDEMLDMDRLETKLMEIAQMLSSGNHQIRLEEFLLDSFLDESVTIQESMMNYGNSIKEIESIFELAIEIKGQSQFSFIDFLKEQHLENLPSHLLSKIATSIYEVILPTNFIIIERHISNELPDYARLGFEAKVNPKKNMDFVFSNPNDGSYTITFVKKGNDVKTVLKGSELLYEYKIVTSDKQTFKPRTIKQYNPVFKPLQVQVKQEGKEGLLIKVYREIYDEKGILLQKELISEDFYPPIYQVEVSGLIPSSKEEEESNDHNMESNEEELPPSDDQEENDDEEKKAKEDKEDNLPKKSKKSGTMDQSQLQ